MKRYVFPPQQTMTRLHFDSQSWVLRTHSLATERGKCGVTYCNQTVHHVLSCRDWIDQCSVEKGNQIYFSTSSGTIVRKPTSEPKFFTNKFQQCSTMMGFGCWCGIDYDRVAYLVRDRMGSRVRLNDFTTGHDSVLNRSAHGIDEVWT